MELDIFDPPLLLDSVTVAELVLERVELDVIVRVPPGLLETSGLSDTLLLIVLVFELIAERVNVAEALVLLEAREADTVVVVVDVFELDADGVDRAVCEG